MGYDVDKVPKLYMTDPSGLYSSWKACAIGKGSKTVQEFFEKNYESNLSREMSIKLAIRGLMEVVQSGAKNLEIAVMDENAKLIVIFTSNVRI